jgi:hypothetical protein
MDGVPRPDRPPINWPLIGLFGLCVEFWIAVAILAPQLW